MMHSTKIAQIIHSAKKGATKAIDKKYLYTTSHPESLVQIQNNFTELFLMMHSTKLAQMVPLNRTKGLLELKIRNGFKRHLLNH